MTTRYYTQAARAALWAVSRGTCYAPRCHEPAVRMLDGLPYVNLEIAHIHALEDNGPRAIKTMTLSERNSYTNLLLLCVPHHARVDGNEADFPAPLLKRWKGDREQGLAPDLNTITDLTQDMLQEVIKDAIGDVSDRLDSAVERLESIAPDLANMVAMFVDTVGVAPAPMMDPDLIVWAHDASVGLRHLEDTAPMLADAANKLRDLPNVADVLASVASELSRAATMMEDMSGY
jgi:hypothetical protein